MRFVGRRIAASALVSALSTTLALAQVPAAGSPSFPAAAATGAPQTGTLSLSAVFTGDAKPIRSGLVWRLFAERGDAPAVLVERSTAASPTFTLQPGNYVVHLAYGFATASQRLTISAEARSERLTVNAGALRLGGAIGDVPIPTNRLSFSVFLPLANDSEGRLIIANAKAGELLRLPEGSYHVVSTYGESNAIMRTDLKVDPGRLTEATLNHRAATMTLKLVAASGGEAFAGTAFSVLTPGGDVIREAIGAFPRVTLAEGNYMLIARHDGRVYTREFKVDSGLDRDVEVMVTPQ